MLVIGISLSVVDEPLRSIWSAVRSRLKCVDAKCFEFVNLLCARGEENKRIKSSEPSVGFIKYSSDDGVGAVGASRITFQQNDCPRMNQNLS